MNVMRRIKSIASRRSSIASDPYSHQGGDTSTKRAKVDQLSECNVNEQSNLGERGSTDTEQQMASSLGTVASTSNVTSVARTEKSGVEQLPNEMHEMRIRDENTTDEDERTTDQDEKDVEATVINGNGTETGQIISAVIGGQNGQPEQTISYMIERVIGTGSFGVVFQAKCLESSESVAIKKVLQDKRYKNRELEIMRVLDHPNVLQLKQSFFASTDKDELYLNLVLDHQLKICDFGSAKMLMPGEPNISYICSRYYRAPELIFGATVYTTAIDMWSVGCVMAELLLGKPLFPGESGVDQLVEIIKILGTPTREEIKCMNPNYTEFNFPQLKAHPWHKIFDKRLSSDAVDLVSRLLQYSPNLRCTPLEVCAHPFFDDLRDPNVCLPNGRALPPLFNFTAKELAGVSDELLQRLIPEHARKT